MRTAFFKGSPTRIAVIGLYGYLNGLRPIFVRRAPPHFLFESLKVPGIDFSIEHSMHMRELFALQEDIRSFVPGPNACGFYFRVFGAEYFILFGECFSADEVVHSRGRVRGIWDGFAAHNK